jgi:hypothetical protein
LFALQDLRERGVPGADDDGDGSAGGCAGCASGVEDPEPAELLDSRLWRLYRVIRSGWRALVLDEVVVVEGRVVEEDEEEGTGAGRGWND